MDKFHYIISLLPWKQPFSGRIEFFPLFSFPSSNLSAFRWSAVVAFHAVRLKSRIEKLSENIKRHWQIDNPNVLLSYTNLIKFRSAVITFVPPFRDLLPFFF